MAFFAQSTLFYANNGQLQYLNPSIPKDQKDKFEDGEEVNETPKCSYEPYKLYNDYDDADSHSSCDDEHDDDSDNSESNNDSKVNSHTPYCFLCDLTPRNAHDIVSDAQLQNIANLMYEDIGHCAPRFIAQTVHRYFKHDIVLPARARGEWVRMWRTSGVLRHMREHELLNHRICVDRQSRLLGRIAEQLNLAIQNAHGSDQLQYSRTLLQVYKVQQQITHRKIKEELQSSPTFQRRKGIMRRFSETNQWNADASL